MAVPFKELKTQAGDAELTYAEGYPIDNSFRQDLIDQSVSFAQSADVARKTYTVLESLPDLSHAATEPPMRQLIADLGLSPNQVFGILRVAVTWQMVSPPLFESMEIVGKDKVLERLRYAIGLLEKMK